MSAIDTIPIPTTLIRTVLSFGDNEEAWNLAGVSRGLRDAVESISRDCLEKIRADHQPDDLFDERVNRTAEGARNRVRSGERGGQGADADDALVIAEETLPLTPTPLLPHVMMAVVVVLEYVNSSHFHVPELLTDLIKWAMIVCCIYSHFCSQSTPFPHQPPLPWRLKLRCAAVVPLEVVEPFKSEWEAAGLCCLPDGRHLVVVSFDHHQVFEIATWKRVTC